MLSITANSIAKALLPTKVQFILTDAIKSIDSAIVFSLSKTKFSSTFYYLIFNKFFRREHQAILKARLKYQKNVNSPKISSSLLRRNIHRLEKGLIMKPRKRQFALNYIEETVDAYRKAMSSPDFSHEEIVWAESVLNEYFEIAEPANQVQKAHAQFNSISKLPQDSANIPYFHKELPASEVSYTSLKQLFIRRRSVRWYLDKHVPLELLEQAIDAASLAPSACNRQPYYFYGTTEANKATEIAKCAMGTTGFAENLQSIIVIMGDLSAYSSERDRHLIYIDASLAAMQLMLALESLGLSTCPINWPELENREKKIRKIIDYPDHQRVVMLLAIGYADPGGGIPFSQKKNHNLLFKEIK